MDTDHLLRTLTDDLAPVRPLGPPWRRGIAWTACGVLSLVVLAWVMSLRDDLGARIQDPRFLIEQAAALLTGVTAAVAAFATVVPGHRRRVLWLPVAFSAVWVATVGLGVMRDLPAATHALFNQTDWRCVWAILAGAAAPASAMVVMLRRGVPLTPHVTAALGGLAAVGLGNIGACLLNPHSSSVLVLTWHCGTALVVVALAGITGRHLLRWPPRHGTLAPR